MAQYRESFWAIGVGTGDIGATKRAQIAKVACSMNDHPDIVLATWRSGHTTTTDSEVALITLASYDTGPLGPLLRQDFTVEIHLKSDLRYYEFEQLELDVIVDSCKDPRETLRGNRRIGYASPFHFRAKFCPQVCPASSDDAQRSCSIRCPPFLPHPGILRTPDACAQIEYMIRNPNNAFFALLHETNDNVVVATMVAHGIITVGQAMFTAYSVWTAFPAIMSGVLSSIGGTAMVSAVIASIFCLVFFVLKE